MRSLETIANDIARAAQGVTHAWDSTAKPAAAQALTSTTLPPPMGAIEKLRHEHGLPYAGAQPGVVLLELLHDSGYTVDQVPTERQVFVDDNRHGVHAGTLTSVAILNGIEAVRRLGKAGHGIYQAQVIRFDPSGPNTLTHQPYWYSINDRTIPDLETAHAQPSILALLPSVKGERAYQAAPAKEGPDYSKVDILGITRSTADRFRDAKPGLSSFGLD